MSTAGSAIVGWGCGGSGVEIVGAAGAVKSVEVVGAIDETTCCCFERKILKGLGIFGSFICFSFSRKGSNFFSILRF